MTQLDNISKIIYNINNTNLITFYKTVDSFVKMYVLILKLVF